MKACLVLALLSTAALSCGVYLQHSASSSLPALALRRPSGRCPLFTSWLWLASFVTGLSGLAVAAGLLYSAGNVATKATVDGTSPQFLFWGLLLVCHGFAFVSLQLSFQRGTALATAGVSALLTAD